jgi:hypothetical protein
MHIFVVVSTQPALYLKSWLSKVNKYVKAI